jgi:hypothetical protein
MKFIATIFILLCIQTAYADDNSGIRKKELQFRWNKVVCPYSDALAIAKKAAIDKFPEYKEKILKDARPFFTERHGGGQQETIIREFILNYKVIDIQKPGHDYWYESGNEKYYYSGSYYRESIEVILNNACEVIDVKYLKGVVRYVE